MEKGEGFFALYMKPYKLLKITIACSDLLKMKAFYSNVFNEPFIKHEMPGFTIFTAKIGEINFLFCPNQIAGVIAEQNRHQFDYIVENLDSVIELCKKNGGQVYGEVQRSLEEKSATIIDPDGNTINFIQPVKLSSV